MADPTQKNQIAVPDQVAILPLRNMTLFPNLPTQLLVGRETSLRLVEQVLEGNRLIGIATQKKSDAEEPAPDDLYDVGVVAYIHRAVKLPDNHLQILVRGLKRVQLREFTQTKPHLVARVEVLDDIIAGTKEEQALTQNLSQQFQKMVALVPALGDDLQIAVINLEKQPVQLTDFVASALDVDIREKQQLLAESNVNHRLQELTLLLNRELSILEMGHKIQNQVQEEVGEAQRQHYLREQMRVIQKELGEDGDGETEDLRQQLEKSQLPEEARKEAERELDRLAQMPPGAAEYTVARTYLDWLLSLPWAKESKDRINIIQARRVLDQDHEGLEKVKERLVEYLAVRKLKKDLKGPIFCFVGPPGVGKTSLGRSIARALGRKFVRISLGGVHDEAEVRGHRRTYIGALPGRIIQSLRKAGSKNPVFMLDEIDKVGADFRGDPAAALLEVLDPEQNHTFVDHYLDVPFDLSQVMFIATANQLDTIPPALRDRLEVIQLSGYTEEEKVGIVRAHLLPRQLKEHGLGRRKVEVDGKAIRSLIRGYTQEAGVRNLDRQIGQICRKIARRAVEGKRGPYEVGEENLPQYLGPAKVLPPLAGENVEQGIVAGLAWTPAGGEVMLVEAMKMPGSKGLMLTGKLGEVMKESAQIALSYVRARAGEWGIAPDFFAEQDIHIHLPSGAIPKDGPSAGVTVATALLSLLLEQPVDERLAMTGEVTLRGRVLPVGGIKEKVLAAHRAGIRKVILPRRNEQDLDELPGGVRQQMEFVLVDDLNQVFTASFADEAVLRAA